MWSYGGVAFALLMGFVCPLSHFGGEMLWHGANISGIVGAALRSSAATWGCMAALWMIATRVPVWIGRLLRLAVAVGVLVVAADAVIVMVFDLRLCFRDAITFGGNAREFRSFIETGFGHMTPGFAFAALLSAWTILSLPLFVWLRPRPVTNRRMLMGLAAALVALVLGLAPASRDPVRHFAVCSVWELVFRDTIGRRYSPAFKEKIAHQIATAAPEVFVEVLPSEPRQPDIVLLIVESWSNYQSRLFGGRRDWTPELDWFAARGVAFTNCIANGFTTEDGLIAILTGEEPIMPATARHGVLLDSFAGFMGAERGLSRLLASAGYRSYFFTNGPLELADKDQFLDSIGLDFLNDSRDPFFQKRPDGSPWPEGCFGAADEALYCRVRMAIGDIRAAREAGREKQPFLAVLETTSSHLPLVCPDGPPHSEDRVMRYVDRAAAAFIRWLEEDGFFRDGGLLVAVSDHRAMLPLNDDEFADFGATAPWRIPLFFLADWLPRGQRDGRFANQTDIAPTLEWLVHGASPVTGRRGMLLAAQSPESRFIAARMAVDRSAATAWDTKTGAVGTIRWNGDKSSATRGLEEALLWLTWERMLRENRPAVGTGPLEHARWLGGSSTTGQAGLTP